MISFDFANDWEEFPELQRSFDWQTALPNESGIVFVSLNGDSNFYIRLNDFPQEPLYTFISDGEPVIHFDNWPVFWGQRPPLPQ